MKIVLLTNNEITYPVLHSQLLRIYDQYKIKKILYCKNKKADKLANYEVINFEKTKSPILNYIWYFLSVRRTIKQSTSNDIFHIRGFVSGIIFFISYITSLKTPTFLYDPRGAFIVEKTEINPSFKYLSYPLKIIEKYLISRSKKTIVTSNKFKNLFSDNYGLSNKYLVRYNCSSFTNKGRQFSLFKQKEINVIYMGTINYWHDISEITNVLNHLRMVLQDKILNLVFLTSSKNQSLVKEKLSTLGYDSFRIDSMPYSEIDTLIQQMHIGISIVRPTNSGVIASPIKISDYIMAGLVIISNKNIGDFDDHYKKFNSAILYDYGNPDFSASQIYTINPKLNESLIKKINCDLVNNNDYQ